MPTFIRWQVPTELSPDEQRVAQKLRRIGKFYVFLREVRAELFDDAFQAALAAAYQPRGVAPVPPALLAMVTLLQAYTQVGDAEAVVAAELDPRWQMPLGCLGATEAPFSQGALVNSAGFAESYRAYLTIFGQSKEDPLLPEVRRRAGR